MELFDYSSYSKRKMKKRNKGASAFYASASQSDDQLSAQEHDRERCTLGALFMHAKDIEAGVTGLELEDVFGS